MKKNQRKQNELRGIKEDLQRLFGPVHGDLWDVSQGGALLVEADVRGNGND